MNFGNFDDFNKEYVIERPDTPYPWINYLGNSDFFSIISNTGGGYSFYRDARLRRITRYRYNNVPVDDGGKYFYINDQGNIWSPGWKPVKTKLDHYECRHGMGYTQISGMKDELKVDVKSFVPLGDACEVILLTLENLSKQKKEINLYSMVEWCLWNALDDMTNFQRNFSTGQVEIEDNILYHVTEYRERRNHYAFFSVNHPIAGFDTDRDVFLGNYNGFDRPDVVFQNRSRNSVAHGWSPIASHKISMDLEPGQKKELVFVLGYIENDPQNKFLASGIVNKTKAKEMASRYDSVKKVNEALLLLKKYWDTQLGKFQVSHADKNLSRMVNIWTATFRVAGAIRIRALRVGRVRIDSVAGKWPEPRTTRA